ncbi:putative short chain dehydrogenase/ reductase [Hypoxylon sp. FL1150]|nr:putative short chain dehydrogenase/ reductase [Hypoxylon sp. FL1150]
MAPITGQSLLVFRGSSVIGFYVTKPALAEGVRVVIASPSNFKIKDAITRLQEEIPGGDVSGFTVDLILAARTPKFSSRSSSRKLQRRGRWNKSSTGPPGQKGSPSKSSRKATQTPPSGLRSPPSCRCWVVEKPIPGHSLLAGYAGALQGLARNLAADLAPLRVDVGAPGSTETELWEGDSRDFLREAGAEKSLTPGRCGGGAYLPHKNVDATGAIVSR